MQWLKPMRPITALDRRRMAEHSEIALKLAVGAAVVLVLTSGSILMLWEVFGRVPTH